MSTEVLNGKARYFLKFAKEIIEKEPDMVIALDIKDIYAIIYDQVPLQFKISYEYFMKLLNANYCEEYYSDETQLVSKNFISFFNALKAKQHLAIYKKMKSDDKAWQREKFILERRNKIIWEEIKEETYNGPTEIKVTFSEDTSSDEADK